MASTRTPNAPRQGKRKIFAAASQARIAQNEQIAGIAGAFGKAADVLPAVAILQQALLGGLVHSQQREADRLATRYGKEDSRVLAASARADAFAGLVDEVDAHVTTIGHLIETFRQDGVFHGYVVQSDTTPAPGLTVRIEILDERSQKRAQRGSAKTDATGYFRIDLRTSDTADEGSGTSTQRFVDRVTRVMGEVDEHAETMPDVDMSTATSPDPAAAEVPTIESSVEVFDATGRLVLEDPAPPTFDGTTSEFRYYVLGEATTSTPKQKRQG